MLTIICAILAGVVAFIPCLILGCIVSFPIVRWCGVTDFEGKSGFYAFFFGGIPAGLAGGIAVAWAIIEYA